MATPFNYHVKVDTLVDQGLRLQFQDLCQVLHGAMNTIAIEQRRLVDRNEALENEVRSLRSAAAHANRDDLAVGNAAAAGSAAGAVVPPAPPPPPSEQAARREGANVTPPSGTTEGEAFKLERTIKIHDAPVHSVKMGPSFGTVATASWDATVKLYDLEGQQVVKTLGDVEPSEDGKMGGLYAVAFAKTTPEVLGCTSCDRSVYLWNHTSGKLLSKLTGHSDEVNGIDFHATQQVMCTASDDCKVIIWDFQEGITLRTLDKHTKAVYGTTFLGQENQYYVATCCFDQKTRVFDMRDKQVVALLQTHTDDVIGIDYSSSRQLLATGSDDGLIGIWDTRTWKLQQKVSTREPSLPDNEVKRVAFSPDGNLLAASCSSGRVLVYDIRTYPARQHAVLGGHNDCVFDVTWGQCPHSNAKIVVSASHDHSCKYWREVL